MNQLIQLWQKAVQDELNVVPRNGLIADLFLAACNNYVDLVALQAKLSTDLRQAFALASEAADAQRDAEKLRNEEFESERQLPMQSPFSRDTDRSNASTPSSSAGCPVERRGSRRPRSPDPNGGPPEEDSESESAEGTKLGYVHKSPLVANHLQGMVRGGAVRLIEGDGVAAGKTVVIFERMRNKAGKEHVLVRLATDASDTLQWVASAHVTSLPALPSGACHDPPRRSLEKDLEPQSASPPQSPREVRPVRAGDDGSTGRRHQENDEPAHNRHSRGQPLEVLPPTSASPFSHALLPTASALLSAIASDAQRRLLSCAECRQRAVADSKIMRLRCPTLHANHPPLQRRRLRRPGVRQLRLKHVPSGRERK